MLQGEYAGVRAGETQILFLKYFKFIVVIVPFQKLNFRGGLGASECYETSTGLSL